MYQWPNFQPQYIKKTTVKSFKILGDLYKTVEDAFPFNKTFEVKHGHLLNYFFVFKF